MELSNGHHKTDDGFDSLANMAEKEHFLPQMMEQKGKKLFIDSKGKTSFGISVFNLSNAIIGSGILGLAYAMAHTGIILFGILLVFIAALSAYSIHLLLKSADVVGIHEYEMLGFRAFGQAGKIIAAFVSTVHNIGAMSTYLYIVKIELPFVIIGLLGKENDYGEWYLNGNNLIMIVSICVVLPLALMRRLGYLGYSSGLSLLCMVFFLISVIYKKFVIECPFNSGSFMPSQNSHNGSNVLNPGVMNTYKDSGLMTTPSPSVMSSHNGSCEAKMFTLTSDSVYTIPITAFAFVCHPEVLPIYTELRKPTKKRMQKVANISILAMFIMYLLTAIFGYLTFYGKVKDELLGSYSTSDTLMLCVRLAVLLAVTLTIPVVLFPIRRFTLQLICPNKPFNWLSHIFIAVSLLVFVNILVIFVPNIRTIFGFIGATTAPSLIFILPGIFYIRTVPHDQEPMMSRPKILAFMFAALGFVFMIGSVILIIMEWVTGKSADAHGH